MRILLAGLTLALLAWLTFTLVEGAQNREEPAAAAATSTFTPPPAGSVSALLRGSVRWDDGSPAAQKVVWVYPRERSAAGLRMCRNESLGGDARD